MLMVSTMEQSPLRSRRRDEPEFNLREWTLKTQIRRENANSRRFSESNIRSSREDTRSFRSNITISSTTSSPGYALREEIDPSSYSFTTAIKALQARSAYSWECLSPDGFALNSKWNEAEKYISNPLSGEVPMECLSAKTLSGRSLRNFTSRITMSAPLIHPSNSRPFQTKPSIIAVEDEVHTPNREKNKQGSTTRDVGTQSTPPDLSSSSPSPTSTPPIEERSTKFMGGEGTDSPISSAKLECEEQVEVKEAKKESETKRNQDKRKQAKQTCRCGQLGGCLSLGSLWLRGKPKEKQKSRKKSIFLYHVNGC